MAGASAKERVWEWTPQKEQAALLLAEGKTWKQIEEENGISHSSLTKWKKYPEFQSRIDEHVDAVVSEARSILKRNATKAAQQVVNLIMGGHTMHTVKLAAAKDVLDRVGLKAPEKIEHGGGMAITVSYADPDD